MKITIGKYKLKNDIDCKATPDGYEIFAEAVNRLGIKPEAIHIANGHPASADWGFNHIIIVDLNP